MRRRFTAVLIMWLAATSHVFGSGAQDYIRGLDDLVNKCQDDADYWHVTDRIAKENNDRHNSLWGTADPVDMKVPDAALAKLRSCIDDAKVAARDRFRSYESVMANPKLREDAKNVYVSWLTFIDVFISSRSIEDARNSREFKDYSQAKNGMNADYDLESM